MKMIAWLILCCLIFISVGACTKKDSSEETATQKKSTEVTEAVEEVALVGKWQIAEWKVDDVDQFKMWRVGNAKVEFLADGSVASLVMNTNGEERISRGTWKRSGDKLDILVKGGGETEGDEPFERSREFTIDELTEAAFTMRAKIGPAEKPIILTYKARRIPAPQK